MDVFHRVLVAQRRMHQFPQPFETLFFGLVYLVGADTPSCWSSRESW